MKFKLKDQTVEYIRRECSNPVRAEEIIRKAELVFNCEQSSCSFDMSQMAGDFGRNFSCIFLDRSTSCDRIEE